MTLCNYCKVVQIPMCGFENMYVTVYAILVSLYRFLCAVLKIYTSWFMQYLANPMHYNKVELTYVLQADQFWGDLLHHNTMHDTTSIM